MGITQEQADYLNELFGCHTRVSRFNGLEVTLYLKKLPAVPLDEIACRLTARCVTFEGRNADIFLVEQGQEGKVPPWGRSSILSVDGFRDLLEPGEPERREPWEP